MTKLTLKRIKWFLYVTATVTAVGVVMLIADGEFDIYGAWELATIGVAIYLADNIKPSK